MYTIQKIGVGYVFNVFFKVTYAYCIYFIKNTMTYYYNLQNNFIFLLIYYLKNIFLWCKADFQQPLIAIKTYVFCHLFQIHTHYYYLLFYLLFKSYYLNVFCSRVRYVCMHVCTNSTLKTTTNPLCVCAHLKLILSLILQKSL